MIDKSCCDLVIFDCDGVLIDSEIIACRIDAEELMRLGYEITADEVTQRFSGLPSGALRAIVERDWGRRLPADFERSVQYRITAAYRRELKAVPGIADLLRALTIPCCVASSSAPEKLRLGLELTGLFARFAPNVFNTTMVANGKPAPDLFLFAAERMGVAPARCVVVEDSVAGVRAGIAAGMKVIGFTGGAHCSPDHPDRLQSEGAMVVASNARALRALLVDERPVTTTNSAMPDWGVLK